MTRCSRCSLWCAVAELVNRMRCEIHVSALCNATGAQAEDSQLAVFNLTDCRSLRAPCLVCSRLRRLHLYNCLQMVSLVVCCPVRLCDPFQLPAFVLIDVWLQARITGASGPQFGPLHLFISIGGWVPGADDVGLRWLRKVARFGFTRNHTSVP